MPFVILFIGSILVVLGIYFVHHQNKTTYWVKKVISVTTTMIGATMIWAVAANYIPPSTKVETAVIGEFADGVVLSFKASNTRGCKIEGVEAFFTTDEGKKVETEPQLFYNKKMLNDDLGYILVPNPKHYEVEKLSVNIKHFCPFGIELKSELKTIKLQSTPLNPGKLV